MKIQYSALWFFLLVLDIARLPAQTETLTYEIYANKGKIGNWEVSRSNAGGQLHLTGKKTVVFKLVKKIKTETIFDVRYLGGQLQQADIQVVVNGEARRRTTIQRDGNGMLFMVEGKPAQHLDQLAEFSNLSAFFEAPNDGSTIFYLQKGIFLPVKALGAEDYEVALSKGEYNRYYYQDGRLVRAVLEDGLLRTTLKLIKTRRSRAAPLAGKD